MINIGLFNESFNPQFDGVAITVENYAKILKRRNNHVVVVVPSHPDREFNFPYTVWEYPSSAISVADQYRIGLPISAKLLKSTDKADIDIVHSHCPFTSGMLAQQVANRNGVPHIATFHSKFREDINMRLKSNMKMPGEIVAKYVAGFYNRCDYIWAVNEGTAQTLRSYGYKGDITVMPNGCDMPITHSNPETRRQIKQKYGITDEAPILLFVGRHTFTKNTDLIIKALGAVNRHNIKFNMLFVGDGEDKLKMEKMVQQQGLTNVVRFAGKVTDREKLRDIYASSDMFVFPSVYDNAPLVVREAAACGCASALIRGSNSAEGLEDGVNAFLSDETVEDLALTLSLALQSGKLGEVGDNARRDIYISWDDVMDMVEAEYERILTEWNQKEHMNFLDHALDFWTHFDIIEEYDINWSKTKKENKNKESNK